MSYLEVLATVFAGFAAFGGTVGAIALSLECGMEKVWASCGLLVLGVVGFATLIYSLENGGLW